MSLLGWKYSISNPEEILHRLYKENHVFHLRKFQAKFKPYTFSQTKKKYIRSNLGRVIPNQRKKYNGCFKEYIKLSCSFYFLNDIEYDKAGLVPSKKSFWLHGRALLEENIPSNIYVM